MMTALSYSTALFAGEGEVRAALRRHNWNATSIGAESSWSPALCSSLQHILWSAFPNLILWGPDFVQLYNEAYLDLIGDVHVAGLGMAAHAFSPTDWEINAPIYARVRAGETISREGALFSVTRSGRLENLYLTLSYAPIHDEHGAVAGVLVTIFEAEDELAPGGPAERHHRDMPPRDRKPSGRPGPVRRPTFPAARHD